MLFLSLTYCHNWYIYTYNSNSFKCLVAVIGFNQTSYTFGEGDGTVEVCTAFLKPRDPSQIAPNVAVELIGFTSPDTADG